MKFEDFNKIIEELKFISERDSILYNNGIDLLEFSNNYHMIIDILISEIYGKEGYDWFGWFCYENNFGEKKLEAWDENKNLILQDVEALWKFLESNSKFSEITISDTDNYGK